MRKNALKELNKSGTESKEKLEKDEKSPPSFLSGFVMIFLGSTTFAFFSALGNPGLGILSSMAFIIIGASRISKATEYRTKQKQALRETK